MINATDNSGRSPLYWAIDNACLEGVNALLAQGAIVTPKLIEAAKRERKRLHSRDNFVKEAVLNSEHIVEILQSIEVSGNLKTELEYKNSQAQLNFRQ